MKDPIRLIVDIAIRALSPAVNDPTTADFMGAPAVEKAARGRVVRPAGMRRRQRAYRMYRPCGGYDLNKG